MPHVNGSSDGDDLGDADEIKVFKHDEECEEEKKLIAEERQSDSLTEDKSSLVTEGESQVTRGSRGTVGEKEAPESEREREPERTLPRRAH